MSMIIANSSVGTKMNVSGQGIVDASGNVTVEFPSLSYDPFQTGTVTMIDSPDGQFWKVYINGIQTDRICGTCSCSGIQVGPGDILQVKNDPAVQGSTPLVAGTIYHGTFACVETPQDNTNLIIPGHDSFQSPGTTTPPLSTTIVPYTPPSTNNNYTFPGQTTLMGVFMFQLSTSAVAGNREVLINYNGITIWSFQPVGANTVSQYFAAPGLEDVQRTAIGGSFIFNFGPLPIAWMVNAGDIITVTVQGAQAGDTFGGNYRVYTAP